MKTLIVYASKTGTTEKCAGIIGQNLKSIAYKCNNYYRCYKIFVNDK